VKFAHLLNLQAVEALWIFPKDFRRAFLQFGSFVVRSPTVLPAAVAMAIVGADQ
jgi:hypothetical protein